MTSRLIALACLLALFAAPAWGQDAEAFEGTDEARRYTDRAFPEAEEGMVRHVLYLEPREDESLYQVELIVGRTILTDGVNRYGFGGSIEAVNVDGWGFTRYVVPANALDNAFSTQIGVPPGTEPKLAFVRLTNDGSRYMVRYNSRLPIVVFLPEGGEVKYRLWEAPEELVPVEEG